MTLTSTSTAYTFTSAEPLSGPVVLSYSQPGQAVSLFIKSISID